MFHVEMLDFCLVDRPRRHVMDAWFPIWLEIIGCCCCIKANVLGQVFSDSKVIMSGAFHCVLLRVVKQYLSHY